MPSKQKAAAAVVKKNETIKKQKNSSKKLHSLPPNENTRERRHNALKKGENNEKEKQRSVEVKQAGGTVSKQTATTSAKSSQYFLVKSEPISRIENGMEQKFSFDDLRASPNGTAEWDGIRNYLARNTLRQMVVGDKVFFYHSNCKVPGIVGTAVVVREAYPDSSQFDKSDPHYDPKSTEEDPRWDSVDIMYDRPLKRMISLEELKRHQSTQLQNLSLFNRSRLSVHRLTKQQFDFICSLEDVPS